jgi:hydroxymethylpyrimidine pyrophosphatase-like HAD family hydrolase
VELSWRTDLRSSFFGITPTVVNLNTLWDKERVIKSGIIVSTPGEADRVRTFLSPFKDSLNVTWTTTPAYPDYQFVNITRAGVSKGQALEALASHLGIKLEEVAAIGDGANDIPLLSTAGLAIAMNDAPPELKALADHITANVEESGVAQAIRKCLL